VSHHHRHCRRPRIGRPAREQVIDRRAERIEIAAGVDAPPLPLLRTHVERRAERHAILGEVEVFREHPREAEVGHLHFAGKREQQVLRFDVAMHDPLFC